MTDTTAPRTRWTVLVLTAALVAVAVGVTLTRSHPDSPGRRAVASLPPAASDVATLPPAEPGVAYVGSRWRLKAVTDRRGFTEMRDSTDAWIDFAPDGAFAASDDINVFSGRFVTSGAGFDVEPGSAPSPATPATTVSHWPPSPASARWPTPPTAEPHTPPSSQPITTA
ncbi:hypothetical protein [Actinoplanes sp. CA-252034]|uniref:hypothetical protein n=1 Tax=Actinoplanes sp. CA-252034 TaxID=3239906 RepID=UPI003D99B24A